MGDRGQVFMSDEGVYLYTHWAATELVETVQAALARHERWDDPEYLARIIFCEMVKGDDDEATGYGIGSNKHFDVWRVVEVCCVPETVKVVDDGITAFDGSFEEFLLYKSSS